MPELSDLILADDAILLMQDAVIAATLPHWPAQFTQPIYALKDDLVARGLLSKAPAPIQIIDYQGFVELTLKYDKVQAR